MISSFQLYIQVTIFCFREVELCITSLKYSSLWPAKNSITLSAYSIILGSIWFGFDDIQLGGLFDI